MAGETQPDFGIDTSDPVALAAAFEKLEKGEALAQPASDDNAAALEAEAKARAEADAAAAKAAEEAQAAAEAAAKAKQDAAGKTDDQEPEGVATKDGKHVIPYSVLKGERDARAAAEKLAREMQDRVAALEAQVNAGNEGAKAGEGARTTQQELEVSEEDLEHLKENFPTVHKAVVASMNAAKALAAKLETTEKTVAEQQDERKRTEAEQVQDAIDSTPKLAHIMANDENAAALAREFDRTLRSSPRWAGKPLEDRFARVVELVEAEIGEIKLPGTGKPATAEKTAEQLKKEAQAAAEAAAKTTKTHVPTSLSDFPAGDPPAKDELEAVEKLSPVQLAAKFAAMSPDQLDAYFRNL